MSTLADIELVELEAGVVNEIYHEISEAYDNEDVRFIFIYGGSSSSKTYSEVQKTITYMMEGSDNNSLIFRKFSTDIDNSIFQDITVEHVNIPLVQHRHYYLLSSL